MWKIQRPDLSALRARTVASTALLAVVIGAPVAASWHGLAAAGADSLGLAGWWSALVPLVLDAAAAYCAVLAVRDVLSGDSALVNRSLTWAYAAGSAALNAWHAGAVGQIAAALFFGAASISAVVLWDRTLRALRRDQLRARGAVQAPTPRFRLARWLVDPKETASAWRLAVLENLTEPAEAVALARTAKAEAEAKATSRDVPAELEGLVTADQIRVALRELGPEKPRQVASWLGERGIDVQPSYVSDVARRDRERQGKDRADQDEPEKPQLLAAS